MTDDRKIRLKALAARAGRTKEPVHDDLATTEDKSGTRKGAQQKKGNIAFRNYAPIDESLSSQQQQFSEENIESMNPSASKRLRTQEVDTAQPSSLDKNMPLSSSKALQNALEEAQRDPMVSIAATNSTSSARNTNPSATVTTIAPKKINWDLKRDINDKLAKLERRTQKAIVRILKERLELEAAKAVDDDNVDDEDEIDLD